ncbi:5-oxoprolinase subunit B family protein [Nocardioides marmoribigeumensis]|uniref:KipI family sensor histidine kinase inhibitor n=1 Tax=Nocardioides marmoribigeumensis TaxID=433649 RepID=A0ABU2BRG6_9ACTN|nr:allophanate hydrolase subunit 1 [Nocardioides marmoribigeumensis]MDR7361203.1 KipI family sensor histidine kinase inhibitor [Nocardioides marmoribigeumensis]
MSVRVLPCGGSSFLLEVDDVPRAYAAVTAALAAAGASAADVVPAARTVLVDGLRGMGAEALVEAVAAARADGPSSGGGRVEVPTVYDGEDLDVVARHWDMTRQEVVATHTGLDLVVAFCGFAPGFAYLSGMAERHSVPRRDSPRPRVPAGSVAVAGEFTGVYPRASPGGWLLLGRTDLVLWDPAADPPALLSPGTRVRFVEVR